MQNGNYPKTSLANGNQFEPIPNELKDLTTLENRILSPRIPFMWIRRLQGSLMPSIKGSLTCIPADVVTSIEALPKTCNSNETVRANLKKRLENKPVMHTENIRPGKIQEAAKFLSKQPLYEREGISLINKNLRDVTHIKSIVDEILPDDIGMEESQNFKIYGGASFVDDEMVNVNETNARQQFDQYEETINY